MPERVAGRRRGPLLAVGKLPREGSRTLRIKPALAPAKGEARPAPGAVRHSRKSRRHDDLSTQAANHLLAELRRCYLVDKGRCGEQTRNRPSHNGDRRKGI